MKCRAAPLTAMRPWSLRRQPAGEPLADPVRRREAAEGVEGGDVDGVGLVEDGRRQERHERLVEVQDVEPMLGQQVARLLLEAPAERDAAHAAVGREGVAGPEADDAPLVLPLLAVLAGDDPHVVAHPAHRLVGVADVLVDAAGVRIAVRADDRRSSAVRAAGSSAPRGRLRRHRPAGRPDRRRHRHSPVGRRVCRRCRALATSCRP